MKITKLNQEYFQGLIDMAIANYNEHNKSVPEELGLMYDVGLELNGEYHSDVRPASLVKSAKITFSWKVGENREEETNFGEDKIETDHFTILVGERVVKLQMYVDELLDRLTA